MLAGSFNFDFLRKGKKVSFSSEVQLRREINTSDVEQMVEWMADSEVMRFMNEKPDMFRRLEKLLEDSQMDIFTHHFNRKSRFYLVDLQDSGNPVGYLRLIPKSRDKLEMVVAIADKDKWNNGLGTRAVWEDLKEAFLHLRFDRVEAKIHKENKPSIRVFKKAGFAKKEDTAKKETFQLTFDEFIKMVA